MNKILKEIDEVYSKGLDANQTLHEIGKILDRVKESERLDNMKLRWTLWKEE